MTTHIGLIGGGNISETHARAARAIADVEIAAILGTSTGTIASRLNRIHRTLERRLSRFATRKDRNNA